MKTKGKIITLIIPLILLVKIGNTQCDYSRYGNAPRELTIGRINESGMRTGHPYTLFVKTDKFNLIEEISKIRLNLLSAIPIGVNFEYPANSYADLYKGIWENANSPEPGKCPHDDGCAHPKWVKNNAIVNLIGLRYEKTESNVDTFVLMSNGERDEFAIKACDGLKNLNPNIEGCSLGDCGFLRRKAFDLIQYAESYDILKATYLANIDDRNDGASCSPRNKLRILTRNFHVVSRHVINSNTGWKKNHGVICASALGLSALVLNSAGVERGWMGNGRGWIANIVKVINGVFNTLTFKALPQPNYSPINWYQRAHGTGNYGETDLFLLAFGEDGIEDNFFVGKHKFVIDVPQTNSDGTAGFAEGPAYFADLCQALLPYFRASANFYITDCEKNYLSQSKYQNILNWYKNILNYDGSAPTYDNSELNWGNLLGVIGEEEYLGDGKWISQRITDHSLMDLRGDFIIASGEIRTKTEPEGIYINEKSGNIIFRNRNLKAEHTFHMLCEKEYAVDQSAGSWDGTHEDDDLGSFMIYAADSGKLSIPLAIDPPYFGWDDIRKAKETNKFWMHNTIEIDDGLPAMKHIYAYPKFLLLNNGKFSKIQEFKLTYDFFDDNLLRLESAISRNVIIINENQNFYYFINDLVDVVGIDSGAGDFQYINYNLNGNGNKYLNEGGQYQDSLTYRKVNGLHRWTYPCLDLDRVSKWTLSAHFAALNNSIAGKSYWEESYTNDTWENGSKASGIAGTGNTLTRLRIHQPVQQTIFQSFLYPQKCNEALPTIKKYEGSNYVSTDIDFISGKDTSFEARLGKSNTSNLVNDTSCHLHLTRWEGNIPDSASNPFNLPNHSNKMLYFNCQKAFLNYHTLSYMGQGYKYCPPSYANFRTINVYNGSYLIYNDTLFASTILLDFQSSIIGKQTYSCLINPLAAATASDTIIIKLPDVGRGLEMIAIAIGNDTIPSRYDSLSNYFYMSIPQGKKEFTIQEKQACQDCYFPPVGTHIDTLFEADDGNRHTLGNKKRINYPDGNMVISNATRIEMCPGVYLQNKDSLIIYGQPQSRGLQTNTCQGIEAIASASNNSMLIVSPGSALVLDAGSRTYIKPGGAIYVKQNGSLVIKDGAFLQIGDSTRAGWGEIIAEQGAYIYIEPNAHIEYRRMIGDTADRNLFHIATGSQPAYAGVYYWMDSMLKAENIIASTIFPIDICSLDSLVPFYNKDWGYTNFAKPIANLTLRNDTLCPGEPLVIRMNRILNDAMAEIRVCRWDSVFVKGVFAYMDCVNDSVVLDSIPPDPICRQPRTMPDEWIYYFGVNTKHQVSFKLMNECGRIVDTSFLVVVRDTPHFDFNLPATACEGYGTVVATAYEGTGDSVYYSFEVTEVLDTATINNQIENPGEVYSQTFYGIVPDSFRFEGYYFRGGRKYNISMSITNNCGTSTQERILEIPLGAYIKMERSTLYANPIHGARSVQLHGYVSAIDSFRWEPLTWLNRGDTLVVTSTPQDSIAYILMAFKDECIAYDTAIIRVRHVANAGVGDTICYNHGKVLLGNAYDMSVFLGYLYFKGGMDFRNMYTTKTSLDETYFKYFSLYMQSQGFKDWANSCANLYEDFTEALNREQTIHQNWYISYFENLSAFDHPLMYSLDTFVYYVSNDSALNSNYTSVNDWGNLGGCIDEMFVNYEEFMQNQLSTINISWYRITDTDTSYTNSIQESSIAIDEPTVTSSYIQTVITESYAEIDQTIVWMDTVVTAAFGVQFQFDSTVIFENFTFPENAGSSYSWNFGDGSSESTDKNALHEFPKFDTAYLVCLSVTNNCGTSMFCDTVYIDSVHWGGSFKTSDGTKPSFINNLAKGGIEALFYPNPASSFGILAYQFEFEESPGSLYLSDAQGKVVFEKELQKQRAQIIIPLEDFAPGIYFYVLRSHSGGTLQGKFVKY